MPLTQELKDLLAEQYYDMLEEDGVSYLEYDRVSNDPPHTQVFIKDEFVLTELEMAQELGFDSIEEWLEDVEEIPGFEGTREALNSLSIKGGSNGNK